MHRQKWKSCKKLCLNILDSLYIGLPQFIVSVYDQVLGGVYLCYGLVMDDHW